MEVDVGIPSIADPRAPSDAAEAEEIGLLATNRGNKLKVGAERINKRRRLWITPFDSESVTDRVKRLRGFDEEEHGYLLPEKDEPYCGIPGIDVPVGERSSINQVLEDPALRQTFASPHVERLAYATMEMIEREKLHYQRLDRLAGILQQDDPWYRDVELADEVLVTEVWERLQDHLCFSGATLRKLNAMRDRLMRACRDRSQLWTRMEELNEEQVMPRVDMYAHSTHRAQLNDGTGGNVNGNYNSYEAVSNTTTVIDVDGVSTTTQVKTQRKKTSKTTTTSVSAHGGNHYATTHGTIKQVRY
ncbi:hypothetical protein BDF22DRAFT_731224 [Syncephalis plumigaleata]|nr:hypothetical protein BDF22DRAFT_731224 [Syncephalis plumigaleata]